MDEMAQMTTSELIRARQKAEAAVKDMEAGPLKTAAFQTILAALLSKIDMEGVGGVARGGDSSPEAPRREVATTLPERILSIKEEGFFQSQKALSDVKEALGSRGWHYPVTTLSGAMQALVRQRHLRRERTVVGRKKVWAYSSS